MNTPIETIFAEFNEELRCNGSAVGVAAFKRFLARCPEEDRRELLSLMNTAYLAYHALEKARRRNPDEEATVVAETA